MAIKLGGGGSASQINEIITLNDVADTVTLADGRVYLKGGVYESTLSTYPDASTTYKQLGISLNLLASPPGSTAGIGTAWDGSYFWAFTPDLLYKYNTSGVYQNATIDPPGSGAYHGFVWDGSNFRGVRSSQVMKFNTSGSTVATYDISSQTSAAIDITTNGTEFFVLDTNRNVYRYNSSMGYLSTVATSVGDSALTVRAIEYDGTDFWIGHSNGGPVYRYNSSWVLQSNNDIDVGSHGLTGILSKRDGTKDLFLFTRYSYRSWQYQKLIGVSSNTSLGGRNYVRVK